MSKIFYEKRKFGYECVNVENSDSAFLEFIFGLPISARLRIGSTSRQVENGVAKVEKSLLPAGDYTPYLISRDTTCELSTISVGEGGVSKKCYDEKEFARLSLTLFEVEERLSDAEAKIAYLIERVDGNPLL